MSELKPCPFCEGKATVCAAQRMHQLKELIECAQEFVRDAQTAVQVQEDKYSNPCLSTEYSSVRLQAAMLASKLDVFLDDSHKDKEQQWASNLNR